MIEVMPQLRISLDDETYKRLKSLAADSNTSPEETAARAVRDVLAQDPHDGGIEVLVGELLDKYGSVFHRLAQ